MSNHKIVYNGASAAVQFAVGKLNDAITPETPELCLEIYDAPVPEWQCPADEQSYRVFVEGERVILVGSDEAGAMYGVLDLADTLLAGKQIKAAEKVPYIKRRGIKLNIPLDARTPSYTDCGDSAQENIENMWDMDFWTGYLDRMAMSRYNVISLWNLSPFPSLVKVPEYPEVALEDVKRAAFPARGNLRGVDFYNETQVLLTLKRMTIDDKIRFWQEVMRYAKDRCISFYLFTWNFHTYGTEHSGYGITDETDNPVSVDYLRKSVAALVRTYPLLAGIGVTAGENMRREWKENCAEDVEWIMNTYGRGVMEGLAEAKERDFTLIHRAHMTTVQQMEEAFREFPYNFELSFKYSQAHMHTAVKPAFGDSFFAQLKNGRKTWLTLRDDDFYLLPWGNYDFLKAYLKAMPIDLMSGFYLGSDGITWGRDYSARDALPENAPYVFDRKWPSFALLGRLAYDIDFQEDVFSRLFNARYGDNSGDLWKALNAASGAVPQIQRVYWNNFDFQWYPEANCSLLEKEDLLIFRSLDDFIDGAACPGGGAASIKEYCTSLLSGNPPEGDSPAAISVAMINACKQSIELLESKHGAMRDDILSMANLGLHYGYKLKAAIDTCLYRMKGDAACREQAVEAIGEAYKYWKTYSASIARRFRPQRLSRMRNVISPDQFDNYAFLDTRIAERQNK